MRELTISEIAVVSGGELDGVDVIASRIKDGWQSLNGASLQKLISKFDALELMKRSGYLWMVIEIADFLGIDDVLLQLSREIDSREDKAQYDESKLKKEVVDGHVQYRVLDEDGNPTNRYWLDCDGDGRLDTQYKDDDGKRYMDVTANGQWHEMPNRSDWRLGWAPPGST